MRGVPLAAPVLLMSTLLAGCTAPGFGGGSATASSLEPQARSEARDWDSDAELVAIIGVEGALGEDQMDDMGGWGDEAAIRALLQRAASDDNIGDGKCEFWAYLYQAAGQDQMVVVVVNRTGGDPWVIEFPKDEDNDQMPIGDYDVDSDEALKIAKEASEGLRDGLARDNAGVMAALGRDESHPNPAWVIMAGGGDDQGGDMGFVIVDAKTGEVIAQFGWDDMMGGMDGMGDWGR